MTVSSALAIAMMHLSSLLHVTACGECAFKCGALGGVVGGGGSGSCGTSVALLALHSRHARQAGCSDVMAGSWQQELGNTLKHAFRIHLKP